MEILCTGGAGLIGRSAVSRLVKSGNGVTVYDNLQLGDIGGLEGAKFIRGDILNWEDFGKAIKGKDQILHLAAPSSMLMYLENPVKSTIVTYEGFLNIMELMRKYDVEKLVFASTSAVYEGLPLPWREDMKCKPPDLKSLSKLQNEEVARLYSERYGITTVALRPLSIYGVGEFTKMGYANVISLFAWAMVNGERPVVWGNGNQTRDFCYVDDATELIEQIMDWNYTSQRSGTMEIFNVGTGIPTSFNKVIDEINNQLGTNYEPEYVPIPITIYSLGILGDMTKVKGLIGWEPKIPVSKGIEMVLSDALAKRRGGRYGSYQIDSLSIDENAVVDKP